MVGVLEEDVGVGGVGGMDDRESVSAALLGADLRIEEERTDDGDSFLRFLSVVV